MPETDLPLRDIHLPEPVSWWPIAPGWWILLTSVIALVLLAYLVRFIIKKRKLKKTVTSELEALKQTYQSKGELHTLIRDLSVLMRRACISFYPREMSAGLTGKDWLAWLDKTGNMTGFIDGCGNVLLDAPYQKPERLEDIDALLLISLCEHWLAQQPNRNVMRLS